MSGASLSAHVVQQPATHLANPYIICQFIQVRHWCFRYNHSRAIQYTSKKLDPETTQGKAAISRHIRPSQVPRPTCQSGNLTTYDPKPFMPYVATRGVDRLNWVCLYTYQRINWFLTMGNQTSIQWERVFVPGGLYHGDPLGTMAQWALLADIIRIYSCDPESV